MRHYLIITFVAAGVSAPVKAAEDLTIVTSEVYQIPGTPQEIAKRANICIAQNLTKGSNDDPLIISSDLNAGTIVARNSAEYGALPRWKIRSRFTFEAREGRFRIEQTNLERLYTSVLTGDAFWGPIGKSFGSGWKKAEQTFAASAAVVAECVMNRPTEREAW